MEDITQPLQDQVEELFSLVTKTQERLKEKAVPVSKPFRDGIGHFHQNYGLFYKAAESGDVDSIIQAASNIAIFGVQISQLLAKTPDLDDEVKANASAIGKAATALRIKTQDDPSTFRPLEDVPIPKSLPPAAMPPAMLRKLEQFMLDQEKQDERLKRSLTENEKRSADLRGEIGDLEKKVSDALAKVQAKYDETLDELQSKNDQINSILGHASGRIIAGDYEGSAASEKVTANWLRWASLGCMALIAAVLGYSFWETTTAEFQWQKSLFRVVLAFLLSAPAAYLARESNKHRMQQYQHHQTSLDLKAIAPYLASLPDEVQHKIKSEVAAKLFAGRELSHLGSDSYPVNTHELLMELVKKLELPKVGASEKG